MRTRIRRAMLVARDRGASAVEYGLMVAAITALIVGIVFGFGNLLKASFTKTSDCLAARQNADYPNCPTDGGDTGP